MSNKLFWWKNAVTADMVSKTTDEQIDRNYQLNFF
jgi:hypothetical protein